MQDLRWALMEQMDASMGVSLALPSNMTDILQFIRILQGATTIDVNGQIRTHINMSKSKFRQNLCNTATVSKIWHKTRELQSPIIKDLQERVTELESFMSQYEATRVRYSVVFSQNMTLSLFVALCVY